MQEAVMAQMRLAELPEPCLEMGERVPHPALDGPIAALGRKDCPASFDGLGHRRRTRVEVDAEIAVGITELPGMAAAPAATGGKCRDSWSARE
jgi:hypothetical protein